MKAIANITGTSTLQLVDRPEPMINADDEVKLKVLRVGICGTDREIAGFQYGSPPPGSEYLVLGHESLAEVVEVGPEVTRVRPGDLVVTPAGKPDQHKFVMIGDAPVPVPPPSPQVMKTMSASRMCSLICSRDSSAAFRPISGSPPAPRPRVSSAPIWTFSGAQLSCRTWASVLTAIDSTPVIS